MLKLFKILSLIGLINLFPGLSSSYSVELDATDLKNQYETKIEGTIDFWLKQDLDLYSTVAVCQPTSVAPGSNIPVGTPYITPKIHRFAEILLALGKLYPKMDSVYQTRSSPFKNIFIFGCTVELI